MTDSSPADSPYRVPLSQLEQARVLRTDQVALVGDGGGPPPAGLSGLPVGGGGPVDGDGD